ncbi:hypothetical protein [Bremerella alba]|uniref:Uncharacterized protein n=1 Tax=Bremerella alba TaxID=980252 RepID=A0A7V9A7M8_9BACT|nr:hypothetical protein [Bremerella alba]MBA2115517.1 hypothetical protein [Bremerella alba]
MHRIYTPTLILILATLLAVGPGWCRLHCAASNDFGDAPVVSCCQAKKANTSQQQHVPTSPDCRCQIQPVTFEVRALAVDQVPVVYVADLFASRTIAALPVLMPSVSISDTKASVPIHVLKCVWRC